MTTWTAAVCETNGISIHYHRSGGAKDPVLLLHGLMGSGLSWTPVAKVLAAGFDVIMPDARGHGGSSAPDSGYGYDDHASDAIGLIHALGLARPLIVGHSMGGMTAAVVASRMGGDIAGLVLVDPTFLSPELQREVYASDVADQHRRALRLSKEELMAEAVARHPRRPREIVELQVEARLDTSIAAFDVLAPPNPDYREVVRAIEVPTLLVIGDRSPVVTPEMAASLQALNELVRVEQIQDAGHGLPFDQPGRLGALLLATAAADSNRCCRRVR